MIKATLIIIRHKFLAQLPRLFGNLDASCLVVLPIAALTLDRAIYSASTAVATFQSVRALCLRFCAKMARVATALCDRLWFDTIALLLSLLPQLLLIRYLLLQRLQRMVVLRQH